MHDDGNAVTCDTDVKFNSVASSGKRLVKRLHCIFSRSAWYALPAMAEQ